MRNDETAGGPISEENGMAERGAKDQRIIDRYDRFLCDIDEITSDVKMGKLDCRTAINRAYTHVGNMNSWLNVERCASCGGTLQ